MALSYRSTRPAAATITQTAITASGNSADIPVDAFDQLAVDINYTNNSGTPSVTFTWSRKGTDGIYYPIWTSTAQTASAKVSASIGMGGPVNHSVGSIGQLSWAVTGGTPNITFTASIIGK